ncbi:hypothetical protein GQ44DRAFT_814270 [Phaeosphaeriaceae sp. PMI808]|nr:hypothetical protein GQ44DRAFT_814270 [Phaeosphaeriaceae sp. PMI808]
MSTSSEPIFKAPPIVECNTRRHCLGVGKKVHNSDKVCSNCLKRYDPQQLRVWANGSLAALTLVEEEVLRKQYNKQNLENHGRYLCAFEDPDFQYCRWRQIDLNLRGSRLHCSTVRRKGKACKRCWRRHLQKFQIVQYFTPTGVCHEESDRSVTRPIETGEMMLAPLPPHCAFGAACDSQPGGREKGPNLCTWCKNMSFEALYKQAESEPDARPLKRLIDDYMHQLERDSEERVAKGWSHLCACKDPAYGFQSWRRDFNPQDSRACGTVRYRGQLCVRCLTKAQQQGCQWLTQWDGDRFGFPCVFEDSRLRRPTDVNWRVGPVDEEGKPDLNWEKDPRRHGRCERSSRRFQLCQKCFNRMCELRGFGRYFDTEWGTLHEGYRK